MNKSLILVVEDDTAIRNLITTTLETQDYRDVYKRQVKTFSMLNMTINFPPTISAPLPQPHFCFLLLFHENDIL